MSTAEIEVVPFSDEDFEELEALLVSDQVPADCMNLEMLDGYMAAIACGPEPIEPSAWLPAVWTADGIGAEFSSSASAGRALSLVLRYYNETLVGIGAEKQSWEPFCYSSEGEDSPPIGDEWVAGFEQGLELWPDEWTAGLDSQDAAVAEGLLANALDPWGRDEAADADDETRLAWLDASGRAARGLYTLWREVGLSGPQLVDASAANAFAEGPGRNQICPCGSGKKYQKCCGAEY